MIDKQLLTKAILAAAWERHPKSNQSKPISAPGDSGAARDTGTSPQK